MNYTLLEYPKCSTCQKARKFLENNNLEYSSVHIVENPPTPETLANLIKLSGLDIKKFFNTSGMVYRELGLKDKLATMITEEKLELLSKNGMLIKRPILFNDSTVIVGFKEQQYEILR